MLPNCSEYKRRLLRLKTLVPDFELSRTMTHNSQQSDKKSGSATGQQSMLHSKEKITCQHTSSSKYDSSELWMRRKPRMRHHKRESCLRRRGSKSVAARALKLAPLQQPLLTSTVSDDVETDMETKTYLDSQTSLLDCQTNNSRRGGAGATATSFGRRGGVTTAVNNANSARSPDLLDFYDDDFHDKESTSESELDAQNSNAASSEEVLNENAVARGANALVKQATSRQTEIIDTSKLLEEGKVETEYEEPEDEPEIIEETDHKLIEEYEKTFAYARRLRALLNMQFKVMDRSSLETNFLLVKAHEHPTQKANDRWRNVDLGNPYDGQIRQQKLIDDFKATCASKKAPKKGEVRIETFPDWAKFYFRFRKDNSNQRWVDYIAYRQKMKKASGGRVTVPKPAEKYMPLNYDIWSTSVVVFAKPNASLQTMVDSVFSKLGLSARADFKFTIGCFVGDTRTGKSKIPGGPTNPEEVTMQATCAQIYKRNCNEVFVNDNRVEMFRAFPAFYRTVAKKNPEDQKGAGDKKGTKGKKGKGKKGEKNQSNLESESEPTLEPNRALSKCIRSSGGKSTKSEATESRQGDTLCSRLPAAVEELEEGSSPSATNQNLSVHDCDSSEEFNSQPTVDGANTTTKSGRSETTKRDSLIG